MGEAWLADSYEQAAAAASFAPCPVVTADGVVFRGPHGVAGGHPKEARGILETKREIKDLRARIESERDALDRLVGETSALDYTEPFEKWIAQVDPNYGIASGGGRMTTTMDRYEADWSMVERGWKTHVLAEGRAFPSASASCPACWRAAARVSARSPKTSVQAPWSWPRPL